MKKIIVLVFAVLLGVFTCFYACGKIAGCTITFTQDGEDTIEIRARKGAKFSSIKDIPSPVQSTDSTLITEWNVDDDFIIEENCIIDTTTYTKGLSFEKYYDTDEKHDGYEVVMRKGYVGLGTNAVVPEFYKGLPVYKIGIQSFYQKKGATPTGDTHILESVSLPDTINEIKEWGFFNGNIKNINIPSNLKRIGDRAFQEINVKGTITIPGAVQEIPYRAFWDSAMEYLILKDGVKTIEDGAIGHNRNLIAVVIPKTIEEIGGTAFSASPKLKTIFYSGTESEWIFLNVTDSKEGEYHFSQLAEEIDVYFYSETQPNAEGNFWHYVNDKPSLWP